MGSGLTKVENRDTHHSRYFYNPIYTDLTPPAVSASSDWSHPDDPQKVGQPQFSHLPS